MINLEVAAEAQRKVLTSIPAKWRIPADVLALAKKEGAFVAQAKCTILSKSQIEISNHTATELLEKMSRGTLSSVEVTEAYCARAAIAHQLVSTVSMPRGTCKESEEYQVNCLTAFFYEEAIGMAQTYDDYLQQTGAPAGPLHGLPVSIKDLLDLKGHPVTMGYIALADVIAQNDSTLVKVLREAGAVFFVKTTMPQTGMALETVSNLWGRTLSPFNQNLVAGGSSGGECALIAMRGSPIGVCTDIAGSIRVPAAFNGLYSIRPSAERVPKGGLRSVGPGQVSIKVSCGPACHSVADLKLFTKIINGHPRAIYDASFIPIPWRELPLPRRTPAFGIMAFDGVVMPHPPILRALKDTAGRLVRAGYEGEKLSGVETMNPADMRTGGRQIKDTLAMGNEEPIPCLQSHLDLFDIKPLSIMELFALNTQQAEYKVQMADFWRSTASATASKLPIDAILCPVHPSTGYPHDFPSWWGYTSIFNLLDYPSTTIPLKDLKTSPELDPRNTGYQPQKNPFDEATQSICKLRYILANLMVVSLSPYFRRPRAVLGTTYQPTTGRTAISRRGATCCVRFIR